MIARALSLLISEKVLIDALDANKISVIGIFNSFTSDSFPFLCPSFYIVTQYGLGQGKFKCHFEIIDSYKKSVIQTPKEDFFLDNITETYTKVLRLETIFIPKPGQYWLCAFIDGLEIAKTPFIILRNGEDEYEES